MPEYLTVNQAAESLGMHPASVRKAIRQGRLGAKKFGRDYQLLRSEIEKYRKADKHAGGRPPRATPPPQAGEGR